MKSLLENARRIFEVACSGGEESTEAGIQDFALLIKPDGGLHFVMESPFSIEGAAIEAGARSAYQITRSRNGVRVHGRSGEGDCVLTTHNPRKDLLRDQPLYRITSPLLTSCAAS